MKKFIAKKWFVALSWVVFGVFFAFVDWLPDHNDLSDALPQLTPWGCIGGCGAGGSGGGGAGKAKWIGMGIQGRPLTMEVMYTTFMGQNFRMNSYSARLEYELTYTNRIGLSLPFQSNSGSLQPQTQFEPEEGTTTGGYGDISIDYSRIFGVSGEFSLSLGMSLPTGQYDIKRGKSGYERLLPQNLQMGNGLVSPSIGLGFSKDLTDNVMMLADISYSHPVAVNFSGRNKQFPSYFDLLSDTTYEWHGNSEKNEKRFSYRFKPYGENDLGAYFPPSISLGFYWAYRGIEKFTHSVGATFSAPLGVAWIASGEQEMPYRPKPDPDNQTWSGSIVYGVQCSQFEWLPFFVAVTLPIHDQTANNAGYADTKNEFNTGPLSRWDGPDWKDFGRQCKVSLAMKAGFF